MTQRNNHSQNTVAIAKPQGQANAVRVGLIALATLVLITVLVLITSPISAEFGFA